MRVLYNPLWLRIAAGIVAAIGIAAASGWVFHLEHLIRLAPGQAPMMFNTALGLILTAGCLLTAGQRTWVAATPAAAVGALGAVTLLQCFTGVAFGLDELFMQAWYASGAPHPGRMGPNTAFAFVLAATATLAGSIDRWECRRVAPVAAGLLAVLSVISLSSDILGFQGSYGWGTLNRMAPLSALAFLVASLGFLSPWLPGLFTVRMAPALAAGGGGIAICLLVWQSLIYDMHAHAVEEAQRTAVLSAEEVSAYLEETAASFKRFGRRWTASCTEQGSVCGTDIRHYFRDYSALESIEFREPNGHTGVLSRGQLGLAHPPLTSGAPLPAGRPATIPIAWSDPLNGMHFRFNLNPEDLGEHAIGQRLKDRGVQLAIDQRIVGRDTIRGSPARQHQVTLLGRAWTVQVPVNPEWSSVSRAGDFIMAGGAIQALMLGGLLLLWQSAKAREAAQARTAAELQAVLDAATGVAIITADLQGLIRSFNRGAERMLGYSAAEVIGRHGVSLIHDPVEVQARTRYLAAMGRHGDGIELFSDELRPDSPKLEWTYIRKDGSRVDVTVSASAIRGPDGAPIGFLGVATDISANKELERQLLENNSSLSAERRRADEANLAKSDFLARMSHEIRTPMNSIVGMADLLWETTLAPEQRHFVGIFRSNASHLLTLVNEILDLSKVEAGEVVLEFSTVSVADLCMDLQGLMSPATQAKNLNLYFEIDPAAPPKLWTDRTRLRQILTNLLSNAIKFTSAGTITVRVAPEPGGLIRFDVRDTGAGIPSDKLDAIFNPFVQADASITRRHGGTGLGLAICKRLAKVLGGGISVDSVVGQGSTFSLTIANPMPATTFDTPSSSAPPWAAASDSSPSPVQPGRALRILVADDSQDNVVLIQAFLKDEPYALTIARNGLEAVDCATAMAFDLILMDVQMPQLDGYAAARRIREIEKSRARPRTPIVTLTAHAQPNEQETSTSAGCDGYHTKPIRKSTLLAAIERHATRAPLPTPRAVVPEELRDLIPAFIESQHDQLSQISGALDHLDFDAIRIIGHNMRGTGGGYGFDEISQIGSTLEAAGVAGDEGGIRQQIASLATYLNNVRIEYVSQALKPPGARLRKVDPSAAALE